MAGGGPGPHPHRGDHRADPPLFALTFGGERPELTDDQLATMDRVILELVPDRVTSRVDLPEEP